MGKNTLPGEPKHRTILTFEVQAEFKDFKNNRELRGLLKIFYIQLKDIYFVHNYGTGHTLTAVQKKEDK